MILLLLGTHPSPMPRLVDAVLALRQAGQIEDRVVLQSSAAHRGDAAIEAVGVVDPQRLEQLMREARVVITHGGPGLIALALAAGRKPVVVPRSPDFDEHVDDHQVRFARWAQRRLPIVVVDEIGDLLSAIEHAGDHGLSIAVGPEPSVVERFAQILDEEGRRT